MKKILAFVIVLCILCSMQVPALAAAKPGKPSSEKTDSEKMEYLWSDMEEVIKASGVSGRFVTFDEVALTFWLPDEFEDVLEKEDKDEGYIGIYMTDDGEGYVDVMLEESDWDTLEEMRDYYIEQKVDGVELVTINGLDALEYLLVDEETGGIFWCESMLTDGGNLVTVSVYPLTDDEDAYYLLFSILSSIQPEDAVEKAA